MKPSICSVAMVAFAKSARRRHLRLNIENQTSIKLSQDACTGRKWNTNLRCGWASSQLATSADQCELTGSRIRWIGWPTGVCSSSKASSSQNSRERCLRRTMPHTWPSLTREAAHRSTVPLRLYSNSRRAGRARAGGRRGTGGWSGAVGWRTPIPGFSSKQNSGPSVGGLRSNSMMATAFSAKLGSRSFIQVSKTVQANLVPLENDADSALAGTAQAKFGMSGHVLGEILDAPVGLTDAGRIDLGWFLTGQAQQPGLDVGMILTRRWTLGTIFETVQAVRGKAVAPEPDGAFGETQVSGDGGIGLTRGDTQDDLGAIGILLRGSAGRPATLQFRALGRQQPNSTATRFGHAKTCFRCFPSQPGELRINSTPESINRTRY